MLNDDFDLFNVDQEVVYDSDFEEIDASIQEEILRISGERFLNSSIGDQFLELICMVVPHDDHIDATSAPDKGEAASSEGLALSK